MSLIPALLYPLSRLLLPSHNTIVFVVLGVFFLLFLVFSGIERNYWMYVLGV